MSADTLPRLFAERVRELGDRPAFRTLPAGGAEEERVWTWSAWAHEARAFAASLVVRGVRPGDRVGILAGNDPCWPVADLGALMARAVPVGLYPTSAATQVRTVLADAGARLLVVEGGERVDRACVARGAVPELESVVSVGGATGRAADVGWEAFLREGQGALLVPRVPRELDRRAAEASPDETAVLIYTSGSTGEPKGARLTHRTLLASARSVRDTLGLTAEDTTLSFLPFCHAAERVFGLYTRILCGMEFGLVPEPARVFDAALAFAPTLFGGLPRFYEKVHEALLAEHASASDEERRRWDRTLELGRARSRLVRAGEAVPGELERAWREAGSTVFPRVVARFGGHVRLATSGGAAFPEEAAEVLDALGLTVLGAYGLTEHLCAAFNRPHRYTFDSVGPAMPGTQLGIAEDGEILIRRSDLTFDGYHGRAEASRAAFTEDGVWLRTGDLGRLDARGFLRVTGRKKDLIALSTGKKVAPLPVEEALVRDGWISQAVLHGERRRFVTALLALRRPVVEAWAREQGLEAAWPDLLRHPRVLERVAAAVEGVNAALSRTERVRRFALLERELSLEADELTPTFKVRRAVVERRYAALLEELYRTPEGEPPGATGQAPATEARP